MLGASAWYAECGLRWDAPCRGQYPLPVVREFEFTIRRLQGQMRAVKAALAALASVAAFSSAHAQSIEPRAYSNAPVGVNFLLAGYAHTNGGLSFDPSLPLTNPELHTSSAVVGFVRALDLWGMSGKVDVVVPYTWLNGNADYLGQPVERVVNGFSDPAFRLSVNFYGAPALNLKDFANYHQDLIIGASLLATAPLGQYDDTRLVNVGANRWSIKPEVGLSKVLGPWTLELQGAATFYTDNNDFYHGNTRSQDPLYSTQTHAIYAFVSGIWFSADTTWYFGGRSSINGVPSNDFQHNLRIGGTLALPVDARNSVKLNASRTVSSATGNGFDVVGVFWQYRFGGGL